MASVTPMNTTGSISTRLRMKTSKRVSHCSLYSVRKRRCCSAASERGMFQATARSGRPWHWLVLGGGLPQEAVREHRVPVDACQVVTRHEEGRLHRNGDQRSLIVVERTDLAVEEAAFD